MPDTTATCEQVGTLVTDTVVSQNVETRPVESENTGRPRDSHLDPCDMASSRQFADQIKQLEQEGSRLMSATNHLGDSLGLSGIGSSDRFSTMDLSTRGVSTSLRALADITMEQKAIDDMRQQLDAQTREADRLSKGLHGDSGYHYTGGSHGVLDRLDFPTSRMSAGYTIDTGLGRDELQYMTRNQLERELRDSKQELSSLRSQMAESITISEKQKQNFRTTVEELKGKLQEAVVGKDVTIEAKKRESAGHEAMVYKLQQTVDHLEQSNRRQEEAILDLTRKHDTVQRDHYVVDMSLNQLRSVISEQERRRGRPYYEGEPLQNQNITLLVRAIEKCVQELDTELQLKTARITQLSCEMDDLKKISEEKQRLMAIEQQDRLSQLQSSHDKQLDVASERSSNSKHQVAALQDQLQTIQRQMDQQLKLKEQYITELEDRSRHHQMELADERARWKEKREALEMACDETQKELAIIKKQRDDDIRKTAVLESRYTDMQKAIGQLEKDADQVSSQKMALLEQEKLYKQKEDDLIGRLKEKEVVISDLKKAFDSVKTECNNQLQQTVAGIEKEGKIKTAEDTQNLTTQLSAITEKCHKLNVELELAKAQQENLKEKYDDLKTEYTKAKDQLQSTQTSKEHLSEVYQTRSSETDRLSQERDRYLQVSEEKSRDISDLKAAKERLSIQLEEREKNYIQLQQQYEKLNDNIITNSKSQSELKDERDELMRRMNDKIIETEELRRSRDHANEKLRDHERDHKELQSDNIKLAGEVTNMRSQVERMSHDQEAVLEELKQSRYEVSRLHDDITTLQQQLEDKRGNMGKEINKLSHKLKGAEQDLKITRKTLKTREHVDGTAVKVADKMQKEITVKRGQMDSLQSRIRWLEESMDTALRDKRVMKEENDKLCKTVKRSVDQTDRLRAELQDYMKKNTTLRDKINKMEAALEKAAIKHAASQAKVEQYEQDLARLKLKHQLELKEIERSGRVTRKTQVSSGAVNRGHSATRSRSKENVKENKEKLQKSPKQTDTGVQEDLKALIDEMRLVLNTHTQRQTTLPEPVTHSTQPSTDYSYQTNSSLDQYPQHPHDMPYVPYTHQGSAQSLPYTHQGSAQNLPYTQQGSLLELPTHADEDRRIAQELLAKYNSLQEDEGHGLLHRPVKPSSYHCQTASDLIITQDNTDGQLSEETLEDSDEDTRPAKYKAVTPDVIKPDRQTQALCKRLEKKIDSLSKLGGHLEKENREMSKLMKDQDRKIKKVKGQLVH